MVTKWLQLLCLAAVFVAVYFPSRHARHYDYITLENAAEELVTLSPQSPVNYLANCTYKDIILNNTVIPVNYINQKHSFITPSTGGEYIPTQCKPVIKAAIIIPYRNRTDQLNIFLNYMHNFLQWQNIHYRIIVAEQNDTLPFNRARMMNYGARLAMDLNYSCLILHDVDLIPLTTGNLYGCSKRPRHMSSSLDTFRYNLPYLTLFGGAIAIQADQFKKTNGMSNLYYGWGGEDDDFYQRLEAQNLVPYRFAPALSKYTMLNHKQQPKNSNRFEKLSKSLDNFKNDGLNSLPKKSIIQFDKLFTRILAS